MFHLLAVGKPLIFNSNRGEYKLSGRLRTSNKVSPWKLILKAYESKKTRTIFFIISESEKMLSNQAWLVLSSTFWSDEHAWNPLLLMKED